MRLVHLAIILCLLGGIAGAILLLRPVDTATSLLAEYGYYKAVVAQFEQQYGARPGDFDRATEIWGLAGGEHGHDSACYITDSSLLDNPQRTCDGNGNGHLFQNDNLPAGVPETAPEWFRAWQHMANAGLIDGHYPGLERGYPRAAVPSDNVPASMAVPGAGYTLMSFHHLTHPKWFPGHYWGLAFGQGPFLNPIRHLVESRGPAISAVMAKQLDYKLDDGHPATGLVRAVRDQEDCIELVEASYRYREGTQRPVCGLFLAFEDPSASVAINE